MSKIQKTNRFEVLGRAKEGFRGAADAEVSKSIIFRKEILANEWFSIGAPRSCSVRKGHR
jgi:uncharacterized membrane protein